MIDPWRTSTHERPFTLEANYLVYTVTFLSLFTIPVTDPSPKSTTDPHQETVTDHPVEATDTVQSLTITFIATETASRHYTSTA